VTLDDIWTHVCETGHVDRGYEAGGLGWHCHECGLGGECALGAGAMSDACADTEA
jgi:hypothetical protein